MIAATGLAVSVPPFALGPLDLAVGPGERVLVSGPSGSGKSTLLRALSGAWVRRGRAVGGTLRVGGVDPGTLPPPERPRRLAAVPQGPDDALIGGTVGDELSFAPRCAGLPADPAAAAARVGLRVPLGVDPRRTSTGERQRLAVGAALAAGAPVLLLDEPLAHLDPAGADALLEVLRGLAAGGTAVILAEHRLQRALPWATRHLRLAAGRLASDGPPRPWTPPPPPPPLPTPGDTVGEVAGRTLRRGERVALTGPNGAGKTTLLRRLEATWGRRALLVPADPDLALSAATVAEELAAGGGADVAGLARALRIDHLLGRPPHAASRGERLRVAVAAALACRPEVLLLDEPTAGQDPDAVEALFDALPPDTTTVFATHDLALADRRAHAAIELVPR